MLHKLNRGINLPYTITVSSPLALKTLKPAGSAAGVPNQPDSSTKDRVDIVLNMIGTRSIIGGTHLLR